MSADRPSAQLLDTSSNAVWADWASLLEASDQQTPYSRKEYADAVCKAFRLSYELIGVPDRDRLSAGILVYVRQRGPYRLAVVPPLTQYTSPLFRAPLRETDINRRVSVLDALIEALQKRYHSIELHLHPSLNDVRPFVWQRWQVRPLYTHRLDMQDSDGLLADASKSVDRRIRDTKSDYVIAPTDDAADITTRHVFERYRHNGRTPPFSEEAHSQLLKELSAGGMAVIYSARRMDGSIEGGQAMLVDASGAYSWSGASAPGPAKTLMIRKTMQDMKARGCRYFDFVGANTPSIAEFKRSFGAPLTTYYRVRYHARPELRLYHAYREYLAR